MKRHAITGWLGLSILAGCATGPGATATRGESKPALPEKEEAPYTPRRYDARVNLVNPGFEAEETRPETERDLVGAPSRFEPPVSPPPRAPYPDPRRQGRRPGSTEDETKSRNWILPPPPEDLDRTSAEDEEEEDMEREVDEGITDPREYFADFYQDSGMEKKETKRNLFGEGGQDDTREEEEAATESTLLDEEERSVFFQNQSDGEKDEETRYGAHTVEEMIEMGLSEEEITEAVANELSREPLIGGDRDPSAGEAVRELEVPANMRAGRFEAGSASMKRMRIYDPSGPSETRSDYGRLKRGQGEDSWRSAFTRLSTAMPETRPAASPPGSPVSLSPEQPETGEDLFRVTGRPTPGRGEIQPATSFSEGIDVGSAGPSLSTIRAPRLSFDAKVPAPSSGSSLGSKRLNPSSSAFSRDPFSPQIFEGPDPD